MNMMKMMQKAGQMKSRIEAMHQTIQSSEFVGEALGGKVKIVMTGARRTKSLKIDPEIANDVEVLEDAVSAAINNVNERIEQAVVDETTKIKQDLGLPDNLDLPF